MAMKVILEAKDIPDNSLVTKITGDKKYRLKNDLKVYNAGSNGVEIQVRTDGNVKFLISEDSRYSTIIEAVPFCKELLWDVNDWDLFSYLDTKLNQNDK